MGNKTLSIITPSYNQADYLSKNIESICSQSNSDVEHIVVDGGSTDRTTDVLTEYEDEYDLRWVSESDRGQTHALNKGFKMTNGDWVGWQNSDDYYLPGAFKKFHSAVEANPQADAVYGDLVIVDENGTEISKKFMTRPSKFTQRYWSLFASNQALFVRRSVLENIFSLTEDLTYTMDAELTWELLNGNYRLIHVPEPLGAFRIQPDAKTSQDVGHLQNEELRTIYTYPWYDRVIPDSVLSLLGATLKLSYLLSDYNIEAIKYNLKNRILD